jgi:hypothetical protein
MSTSWPYPGSRTVVCSMGEHEHCNGNCSCHCHLQGRALPVIQPEVIMMRRLDELLKA